MGNSYSFMMAVHLWGSLSKRGALTLAPIVLLLLAGASGCTTLSEPKVSHHPSNADIKTIFAPGAKLSSTELDQIAALANQCGMQRVGEVETGYMLPTGTRSIKVRSKERIEGPHIYFDLLCVERIGWFPHEPKPQAKRVGKFWTADAGKSTQLVHEYKWTNGVCRVLIADGVDPVIADQAIAQILAGKVQFEDSYDPVVSELLLKHKLATITVSRSKPGYELRFGEYNGYVVRFRVKEGEVLIIGIGSWVS
jgi:hypothetical protein